MQITTLDPLTAPPEENSFKQSLSDDFDNFLTMLTTQLQNQDPMSPLDSTEFTNQLVQFSQLEQQINQSDKLDDLIAMQKATETTEALSYLGKEVEMVSAIAMLNEGEAKFSYDLPPGAEATVITVFDERGFIVRNMAGETDPGRHDVVWDGTDNQGVNVSDGAYSVLVSAADEDDEPLTDITVYSKGIANEVITDEGVTYLRVGDLNVPLDRVVSVTPDAS